MLPISAKDLVRFTPYEFDVTAAEEAVAVVVKARDAAEALAEQPPPAALAKFNALVAAAEAAANVVRQRVADLAADGKQPPIYVLAVPSLFTRAAFRRDVTAAGAVYPTDAEMFQVLRGIVTAAELPAGDALLETLDRIEAANGAGGVHEADDLDALKALVDAALKVPAYARMHAARNYWLEIAPAIACRHFLKDVENGGIEFRLSKNGLVPDDVLAAIEEERQGRVAQVGFKAMNLTRLSNGERKNSASPSPSPSGPRTSPAAPTRPTAAPDGSSSASSSPETRALH